MPGIMGSMNPPPPPAAQPTTLATSPSAAPGMSHLNHLNISRFPKFQHTNLNFRRSKHTRRTPPSRSKRRTTSTCPGTSRSSSTTTRSTRSTSCCPSSRCTTSPIASNTCNNDSPSRTFSSRCTSRRRHSQWWLRRTIAKFSHSTAFGQDVSYRTC